MSSQKSTSPPSLRQHDSNPAADHPEGTGANGRKKRVRNWSTEDRAAHRVFERSRREAFKGRLTSLAGLIPNLQDADHSRLSKHIVIDEAITLVRYQQQKLDTASRQVSGLEAERDELLTEVNQWRATAGMPRAEARPLEPLPEPIGTASADGRTALTDEVIDEDSPLETQVQPAVMAPRGVEPLSQAFEAIPPPHLTGLENPAMVTHTGVTPPNWDMMGMDLTTQTMAAENNMPFNDLYAANMVPFPPGAKQLDDPGVDGGSFDSSVSAYQPPLMNLMNPIYAGDPHIYGQ